MGEDGTSVDRELCYHTRILRGTPIDIHCTAIGQPQRIQHRCRRTGMPLLRLHHQLWPHESPCLLI